MSVALSYHSIGLYREWDTTTVSREVLAAVVVRFLVAQSDQVTSEGRKSDVVIIIISES